MGAVGGGWALDPCGLTVLLLLPFCLLRCNFQLFSLLFASSIYSRARDSLPVYYSLEREPTNQELKAMSDEWQSSTVPDAVSTEVRAEPPERRAARSTQVYGYQQLYQQTAEGVCR